MGGPTPTDTGRPTGGQRRRRRSAVVVAVALLSGGCGGASTASTPPGANLDAHVVATFERAVLQSRAAYLELFDFAAVGAYEKLLRRHDLLGRLPNLSKAARADLLRDTPEPYPVPRERRNLGAFYPLLAQRTVGKGGCTASAPQSEYGRKLGMPFPALPTEHAAWDKMRPGLNRMIERGGVVALRCRGGKGSLALVYTRASNEAGFRLITMYDDVPGY